MITHSVSLGSVRGIQQVITLWQKNMIQVRFNTTISAKVTEIDDNCCYLHSDLDKGLILGLRPANERRRYKVTPSLIGWAQT